MMKTKLIQIEQKNLADFRKKQWKKQNKKCPVLDKKIPFEKSVMDHKHITKKEIKEGKIGEDGKGLLRGVLHNQANAWEGKISNSFKRTGMHKLNISISDALEGLAKYLRNPLIEQIYIHPTEKERPKYLGKRQYNKIVKYYFLVYPKRKKFPVWKEDKNGNSKIKLSDKWYKMIDDIDKYIKGGK